MRDTLNDRDALQAAVGGASAFPDSPSEGEGAPDLDPSGGTDPPARDDSSVSEDSSREEQVPLADLPPPKLARPLQSKRR